MLICLSSMLDFMLWEIKANVRVSECFAKTEKVERNASVKKVLLMKERTQPRVDGCLSAVNFFSVIWYPSSSRESCLRFELKFKQIKFMEGPPQYVT